LSRPIGKTEGGAKAIEPFGGLNREKYNQRRKKNSPDPSFGFSFGAFLDAAKKS
jgi:hypothetical protein